MKDSNTLATPENATGNQTSLASPFTDKRGYAQRWQFSTRKCDDLIAQGLPHLKIGKRRVRICIMEADSWMQAQFRVQRRAALATSPRRARKGTVQNG
jgi:hypothetical protein